MKEMQQNGIGRIFLSGILVLITRMSGSYIKMRGPNQSKWKKERWKQDAYRTIRMNFLHLTLSTLEPYSCV